MADSQTSDRVVAGRYRLIEPLGRGGMGIVWRALDEILEREVAVKELRGMSNLVGQDRETFIIRTFREARAAGRLSHPGIVGVYDVFEDSGRLWIVMELVPSQTLGSIVRKEGPLPPLRVAEIGAQLLAGLRAAHAAGVLHRDVKPDNVLIADDGRTVLTDFGIAALEDDSPITHTGMLVGTPSYIAPERAAGAQAKRASDLWSLGVTMFFAVEGRSPFERSSPLATLAAVLYDHPGPLELAGPLAPVIDGLLIKEPTKRLRADEAARHLSLVAEGHTAELVRATRPAPISAVRVVNLRTRWGVAAATGAVVLSVGMAAGGSAYLTARTPDPATSAQVVSTPTVTVFQTRTLRPPAGEVPDTRATTEPPRNPAIRTVTVTDHQRKQKPAKRISPTSTRPMGEGKGKGSAEPEKKAK
jgi:serine/threonine protein kinase